MVVKESILFVLIIFQLSGSLMITLQLVDSSFVTANEDYLVLKIKNNTNRKLFSLNNLRTLITFKTSN